MLNIMIYKSLLRYGTSENIFSVINVLPDILTFAINLMCFFYAAGQRI